MYWHLLTQTLTYAEQIGVKSTGQGVYGVRATMDCRWEQQSIKITDDEGVERVGSHISVTRAEIPANSRVWGPFDDPDCDDEARRIIGRNKAQTPDGRWLYETVF